MKEIKIRCNACGEVVRELVVQGDEDDIIIPLCTACALEMEDDLKDFQRTIERLFSKIDGIVRIFR